MSTVLETPTFVTVTETAALLRVSRRTIYRRIAEGSLAALRLGNTTGPLRIAREELERFCQRAATRRNR